MTELKINNGRFTLVNNDCLQHLKTLEPNSVDLIVTDPPYFQVKKDAWDNQWTSEADFLAWLDEVLFEYWRVLKPSGSLYLFCSDRLAAKTEVLIGQRFNVLNHIVWRKENGVHKRHRKEGLRRFAGQTERIIFAEHYGADGVAKGSSGYQDKCQKLKSSVFEPLISYFSNAKEKAGVPSKLINEATGTQMSSHWFTPSQWKLPTKEQYAILQSLFENYSVKLEKEHSELAKEYSALHLNYVDLSRDYDELKQQYETLRRPFSVTADVPYTDVWDFNSVQYYEGKHPCEKPLDLIKHIMTASSRPGLVVLDTFLGSGKAIARACVDLDCQLIGVEMDPDIFRTTVEDLSLYQ
ncbi:DNA-methyltransferase [Shewanella glacialipiscicola]|uniref:DNA-methyltransferase n=1 Tax=Shewanella glacialipiscicola TaxID=614069 RepID=UPI003D79878F